MSFICVVIVKAAADVHNVTCSVFIKVSQVFITLVFKSVHTDMAVL